MHEIQKCVTIKVHSANLKKYVCVEGPFCYLRFHLQTENKEEVGRPSSFPSSVAHFSN